MVNLFIVIFFPEVTGLNVEIKGLIMPVQTSDTIACVRYDEWFELNGVTACQIFWLIVNVEVPDFSNIYHVLCFYLLVMVSYTWTNKQCGPCRWSVRIGLKGHKVRGLQTPISHVSLLNECYFSCRYMHTLQHSLFIVNLA